MRIFLIRHAETVHNIAQAWAGTTDSALTNHGVLQIEHLAQYFATNSVQFTSIFASDLSRARITAEGICRLQPKTHGGTSLTPSLTPDLREKDFGSLEGVRSNSPGDTHARTSHTINTSSPHIESESTVAMRRRATSFLDQNLLPLLFDSPDTETDVAIVAHGIILRVLWNCLVELFDPMSISLAPGIPSWRGEPAALVSPAWSNTGFMILLIQPSSAMPATESSVQRQASCVSDTLLQEWTMQILAIDKKDHLAGLRRTRGGIGSASHDVKQKRLDQFFKR